MLPPLSVLMEGGRWKATISYQWYGRVTGITKTPATYYSMCHCYPYQEDRRWCWSAIDESTPLTRGDVRSEHNIVARAYHTLRTHLTQYFSLTSSFESDWYCGAASMSIASPRMDLVRLRLDGVGWRCRMASYVLCGVLVAWDLGFHFMRRSEKKVKKFRPGKVRITPRSSAPS
jgi:hypothetical protein